MTVRRIAEEPVVVETPATRAFAVGRTIAKNTIFITVGSVALKILGFLFNVYVVRQLGGSEVGRYYIVLAWVGLFQIFAEFGVSQYVMRAIAQDRSRTALYFWNLLALRLLLGGAGIVGVTLGAAAAGYSADLVLGVFIYTWTFILSAVEAPIATVLTAHERLDYVAALAVVVQLSFVIFGTVVLHFDLGYIALIAVGLAAMLPQIGLAIWAVKRHCLLNGPIQIQPHLWLQFVRAGLPFGIISLALTVAFSIDTVMLSHTVPDEEVGWYNVSYGLVRSLVSLLGAFSVAMVPSLSRAYVTDTATVERWYYRSIRVIAFLTVPLAVGGTLICFPLVSFLYSEKFLPAAIGLSILIWDVPLLMYTAFCGNMTTVVSEEQAAARIYTLNAVANVLLNLYAIPRYGMVGAALVTVITDFIGMLQFHFLLRRGLNLPNMSLVLIRIALASTVMGVAVWFFEPQHFSVRIAIGIVTYAGSALALRVLDAEEWIALTRLFRWSGAMWLPKAIRRYRPD